MPYPIFATYDKTNNIFYKSILGIKSNNTANTEFECKFLLGLLNSKLIGWYFTINSNKNVTKTFPRISLYDLKKFPLPQVERNQKKLLVDIVQKILNQNELNKVKFDDEIDKLVYQLYELTEEEIKIVEGA